MGNGANSVLQSGAVTPGHVAIWTTNNVVQDGGALLAANNTLGSLRSANFNSTADQAILLPTSIAAFQLTGIVVTNASAPLLTAVGGFYTAASKGGSAIVAASQAYSSLLGIDLLLQATLTAFAQTARFSADNLPYVPNSNGQYALAIYLSLTTPNGNVATADVYVLGLDLT